jgi:hypothetical protein
MAKTLSSLLTVTVSPTYTNQRNGFNVGYSPASTLKKQLASGTGSGQADRMFDDIRHLNASASEDLDLAGGLSDGFGETLTFVKIKAIYVEAAAGNTNDVVVGGASANAFVGPFGGATHTLALKPGQAVLLMNTGAGWTVTPATGDLLKIANGGAGTGVDYTVIIIGTSA